MDVRVFPDAVELARACAGHLAARLEQACAARGTAVAAFSGGKTPARMLGELAARDLPWERVHVVQVDERVAPDGDPQRNWTMIERELIATAGIPGDHAHPMPVTDPDLKAAAVRYAGLLRDLCREPPVLDVVHLGLGPDGHVASLVPGDPALDEHDLDVTLSGPYQDHVRMTLTFPALNRARSIVWQVEGADKAEALRRLRDGLPGIPGSSVRSDGDVVLFADEAATASAR